MNDSASSAEVAKYAACSNVAVVCSRCALLDMGQKLEVSEKLQKSWNTAYPESLALPG
jgi:hypothetical protein